jgi:hypothetical protein
MRKIDWDKKLSTEDITWLQASGMYDVDRRIAENAEKYGSEVPETDTTDPTRSALTDGGPAGTPIETGSGPRQIDPTNSGSDSDAGGDDEDDDYDEWPKADLEKEVEARNKIAAEREDVSEVTVTGTGSNGNVVKDDLVRGLRLWDQENPNALD